MTAALAIATGAWGAIGIGTKAVQFETNSPEYNVLVEAEGASSTTKTEWHFGEHIVKCNSTSLRSVLVAPAPTLVFRPSFSGCEFYRPSGPITVTNHGCGYVWQLETETSGTLSLTCPAGQELELSAPMIGLPGCSFTIPPQTIGSIDFTGSGLGGMIREVSAGNGLTYTYHRGSGSICAIFPGEPTGLLKDGTYKDNLVASS